MLTTEIARRLELRLKLGQFPLVRRRLYARVQRICIQAGEPALKVVADLLQECEGPRIRDAGQYFCWVIKRRLEENGISWDAGSSRPGVTPAGSPVVTVPQLVQTIAKATADRVTDPMPTTRAEAEDDLRRKLEQRRFEETKARLLATAAAQEVKP
jgi:hypothetical protein